MEEEEEDDDGWVTAVEAPRFAETACEARTVLHKSEAPWTAVENSTELAVEAFPVPHDEDEDEAAFDADADADDADNVIISSFS